MKTGAKGSLHNRQRGVTMGRKILLIEDDRETASYIAKGLTEQGHVVDHVDDGREGLFLASDGSFDLVILDRMLPGLDGLGVLRALRAAEVATPVLILSALASVDDRIEGLDCGSDDYLVKPFAFSELIARTNALLAPGGGRGGAQVETRLVVGDLEIDLLARTVKRAGKAIDVKPARISAAGIFRAQRRAGESRARCCSNRCWDYHFDPGTNVIDVHVSRLRRKLETALTCRCSTRCVARAIGSQPADGAAHPHHPAHRRALDAAGAVVQPCSAGLSSTCARMTTR
jgi:two-component system OmpR family response regulator